MLIHFSEAVELCLVLTLPSSCPRPGVSLQAQEPFLQIALQEWNQFGNFSVYRTTGKVLVQVLSQPRCIASFQQLCGAQGMVKKLLEVNCYRIP